MAVPAHWTEHRRVEDRELLGWIRPEADLWVPVSLFGHDVGEPMEWLEAEEVLDRAGLSWLTERWMLDQVTGGIRVKLVEVSPERIVVTTDDFGAIDAPVERFELSWPSPPELRPARRDEGGSPWG